MSTWNSLSREQKLAYWSESERMLTALLEACAPYLADHEKDMAKELIDHNEHQLALEFLFDYLAEAAANYPNELIDEFRALDARLHLTGSRDVDRLGRV